MRFLITHHPQPCIPCQAPVNPRFEPVVHALGRWLPVETRAGIEATDKANSLRKCNRGKSPGTQVQHTLEIGMRGMEFRHFWAFDCGMVWTITKSARGFAPVTFLAFGPPVLGASNLWRRSGLDLDRPLHSS